MPTPSTPSPVNVVIPGGIEKRQGYSPNQTIVGCFLRNMTYGDPSLGDENYPFGHAARTKMIADDAIYDTMSRPLTGEHLRLAREVMGVSITEDEESTITFEFAAMRYWTLRKEMEEEKTRIERAKQHASTKPFII